MLSGYVLDFSNRTFQEFIYEKIHLDIYVKYQATLIRRSQEVLHLKNI